MNRVIIATIATIATTFSLALTGTHLVWAAAGQTTPTPDPKIGTRVIITGCLHQGGERDSFVLLGVTERPADALSPIRPVPLAIYWLDSTDGLKELVGEIVDVTGTVTGRRPKPGTITVSIDPSERREKDVQVSSNSGTLDVTTKSFDDTQLPVEDSASSSTVEVSRPVYKLDVEHVRAVNGLPAFGPACR